MKYLEADLVSLKQVITVFAKDIHKLETLNVTKTPTISSLAFKALTINYFKPGLLYQIKQQAYKDMRRALYGGVCEAYNLVSNKKIYVYDLNSSYPASMLLPMPVGKPVFSTENCLDSYFGIVYAEVETPMKDGEFVKLLYPPLPFRLNDGRIINPIGR